jgi:DNA-directed RNA polymerase subunit K/omega
LNEKLLEQAKQKVSDVRLLINGASRRAAEIARGGRPLIPTLPTDNTDPIDIALQEIIEDKIEIVGPELEV